MNILTIDIEEWFHVVDRCDPANWETLESRIERNVDFIFESMITNQIKATFFVVGWIARKYPGILKKIHQEGFEIGSHSNYHKICSSLSKESFKEDLKKSIETIEDLIGQKIRIFRAPCFSISNKNIDHLEILFNNGIEIDCSISAFKTKNGGFNLFPFNKPCLIKYGGATIKEFPLSTYKIFNIPFVYSGGGYFRLLPFEIIQHLFKHQRYNMCYFHPRDFDPNQPSIDISILENIKRNIGIKNSRAKFEKMITLFDFSDIGTSEGLIDWTKVDILTL